MPSGFLLIDKPLNWTAFDVIAFLRKKIGIKGIGHTGTLDPLATGLMVIGVGTATRFLEFHTGHTKEYEAEITLGAVSETYDAEGPIQSIVQSSKSIVQNTIQEAIQTHFLGEIEQVPPKYSALKINGEKYCNLVRKGIEVDTEAKRRKITIFENEILSYQWPVLCLRIKCSSGTYIRSIAHNLGQILACGGYLSGLRRTQVEDFRIEQAKKMENISEADFLSLDSGLHFPRLELDEKTIKRLQFGQRIPLREIGVETHCIVETHCNVSLQSVYLKNTFYGVVQIKNGVLSPYKMLV